MSQEELTTLVGDLDTQVLQQLVASNASRAEIAEAVSQLEAELGFDDRSASRSPRVALVRSLLEPLFEARDNILRGRD
jgi:hypothetical protein